MLAPPDLWQAVVLVDVTPRMEMEGARRVVAFMSAHPEGFDSLESAADVIAAYNPHRPRPENLDGLRKSSPVAKTVAGPGDGIQLS